MPRLTLDLPDRFRFSTELCIYTAHINQGGHLDNVQILHLYSEARRRFFAELGYSEANVEGLRTVMADALVIYRSEAFVGETLVFQIAAGDNNRYGGDLIWCAHEKLSGREVARGKSGFVFVDPTTRRPSAAPLAFRERVALVSPSAD